MDRVIPVVMLDPGHGYDKTLGGDPGAQYGKVPEDDINLAVAKLVRDKFKIYAPATKVLFTHEADCFVSIPTRVQMEHKERPDCFVSIHCNAVPKNPSTRGFEIWVWKTAPLHTRYLAISVEKEMLAVAKPSLGIKESDADPATWQPNLGVLRDTKGPAILVELGCMTNISEREQLNDSDYQRRLAGAIAKGIINWLKGV